MSDPPSQLVEVSQLDGWATQWDRLVDEAPLPSPFLRSWWLTGAGGPQRCFVLAVAGERLVGGLAVDRRGWPGLDLVLMMGDGRLCPDHMDLVAAPGEEDVVIGLLADWFRRPGGRFVELAGVPGDSRVRRALPGTARCVPFAVAPWIPLPGDASTYLAGLSSQLRRNIRRATARVAAEGASHRSKRGPSAVESLGTLRAMHVAQWGSSSRFLTQFDRFAAACRLGVEADEVVVHELATDETVVSIVVSFEVAGRVSLYQSARLMDARWRNGMTVLLAAIISDACDRGFREVDLLRGEEPYKGGLAPERRELFKLLAASGTTGQAAKLAKSAVLTTRRMAEASVHAGRRAVNRMKTEQ